MKTLFQPAEMPAQAQDLVVEAKSLYSQISKVAKTRDDAICSANGKVREAKLLEFCSAFLKDELDSLERKELLGCDMEIVDREVAEAKHEMNTWLMRVDLVDGLR